MELPPPIPYHIICLHPTQPQKNCLATNKQTHYSCNSSDVRVMLWCLQHQCSAIGPLKVPVETCNICREFLEEMVREFTLVQRRWMLEQRLLGRSLIAIQLGYEERYGFFFIYLFFFLFFFLLRISKLPGFWFKISWFFWFCKFLFVHSL